MPYEDPAPDITPASELAEAPVTGPEGERLGAVEEVMIDAETGTVAYLIVNFAPAGAAPEKLTAVPWPAVRRDSAGLVLTVDPQTLREAPGFERDAWPDMTQADFKDKIYGYWGVDPHRDHRR